MNKIETLRLGAHVFERLSLAAQTDFALAVLLSNPLGEPTLADLGKIDRGAEFLSLYGTKLKIDELINVLSHVDRFTEMRLVDHLEVVAPDQAEALKRRFFVFEDLVVFDPKAIQVLVQRADAEVLAVALGGTELKVRLHVLDALPLGESTSLATRIERAEGDRRLVRSAQEDIVTLIKDLEQTGRLRFHPSSAGTEPVFTTD